MVFSQKLKQLRIKNEYSQGQLADMLDVSRIAVTKWESGRAMPDIYDLKSIAELFGISLDSLVEDVDRKATTNANFCWKLCFAATMIGFVIGWVLRDMHGANIMEFAFAGAVIGYAAGYIIVEIRKKFKDVQ